MVKFSPADKNPSKLDLFSKCCQIFSLDGSKLQVDLKMYHRCPPNPKELLFQGAVWDGVKERVTNCPGHSIEFIALLELQSYFPRYNESGVDGMLQVLGCFDAGFDVQTFDE